MKTVDPVQIELQNRRKREKDLRRKNYHDSQVQGTNNSSIVSKRSVEMIYNPLLEPTAQQWFQHFVPKAKRRSPAINRGYWIRMESIKESVLAIQHHYQLKVRVVNLGCGFDPFPFKMLSENEEKFEFFDFDYPELVAKKLSMIQLAPEILGVIGAVQETDKTSRDLGVILATPSYKLVGCDLKNTSLYERQLHHLLSSDVPSIFIAEVSLAYMKPEHANPVIQLSSKLAKSHFLVLEQIMPSGPSHFFAQKMLYHFSHLRSPLQCVETYSTKEKQKARFQEYFPSVEVVDMFQSWKQLVSAEKKHLVSLVEDFDEWEEFIVFCQHYVVIHASNSEMRIFCDEEPAAIIDNFETLGITPLGLSEPKELKFAASAASTFGTYVHGGMEQTRSDCLLKQNVLGNFEEISCTVKPSARMCHTLTDLKSGHLLLVGGRTRPGAELEDIWVFDETSGEWALCGSLGVQVSRHAAVVVAKNTVILFGNGKFFKVLYSGGSVNVLELGIQGSIPALKSCGMWFSEATNRIFIVGGMSDEVGPTFNDLLFEVELGDSEVTVDTAASSKHFKRIGCVLHGSDPYLYIFGGAGGYASDQKTTVIRYEIRERTFTSLIIPGEVWETYPLFIGSQMAGLQILGGGAVCYSFGSCYNAGYRIEI